MLNQTELEVIVRRSLHLRDFPDIYIELIKNVSDYIANNLELSGAYVGSTASGSPDPSSGPYKWECEVLPVNAMTIANLAKSGQHGSDVLKTAFELITTSILFSATDTKSIVTLTPPVTLAPSPGSSDITIASSFDENISLISKKIISTVLDSIYTKSVPSVSSTSGMGSTSLTSLI